MSMSLFDCVVNHALVRAFPFRNDMLLLQLARILNFSTAVKKLLKKIHK